MKIICVMAPVYIDVFVFAGGPIDARDIVDGHREKTLHLLWRIIFNFQVLYF